MNVIPVTLANEFVTLEAIAHKHCADLVEAIDADVFRYMPMRSSVVTPNEVRRYIEFQSTRTNTIAFAVIDNATGKAIGSSSYINIMPDHYGLEIGSTWITKSARGTKVNPSMKLLMLRHAFEELGAIRVVLSTDNRNEHSKGAISKLGAQFEGVLRNHIIMPDGHFRDSALYSIIHTQWEPIREKLLDRIGS
jgi:N-acetyltransferase